MIRGEILEAVCVEARKVSQGTTDPETNKCRNQWEKIWETKAQGSEKANHYHGGWKREREKVGTALKAQRLESRVLLDGNGSDCDGLPREGRNLKRG